MFALPKIDLLHWLPLFVGTRFAGRPWKSATAAAVALIASLVPQADASLERALPAGGSGPLLLQARPAEGVRAWAVEEVLPVGASATAISHGGSFDRFTGKVKWGPFLDALDRDLSYWIVAPGGSELTLTARVSWDGAASLEATGPNAFEPVAGGFSAWLVELFGPEIIGQAEGQAGYDGDGDFVSLLAEYYFGLDPSKPDQPYVKVATSDDGHLLLTLRRRISVSGVSLSFERSEDLQTWAPVEAGEALAVEIEDQLETVTLPFEEVDPATYLKLLLSE